MSKSLDALFQENDWELISGVFDRIIQHYGNEIDATAYREEERVVILTWHAAGIIGNGGFNYLFEGCFRGDPYFARTAEAFETIGCKEAAAAFRKALALFPEARPPSDLRRRLELYRGGQGSKRHEIDTQFFGAHAEITKCLARYIRANRQAYEHLLAGRPGKRATVARRKRRKRKTQGQRNAEQPDPAQLPHWARVAFAARCARRVFPLFSIYWPNALPERPEAVVRAIELAERSAAQGRPANGLKEAVTNATMVSGMAIATSLYGFPDADEPVPADGNAGAKASFVTKVAERAAEAAQVAPSESLEAASDAFRFAWSLCSGKEEALLASIYRDLANLCRVARRGRWTDETPVPPSVFDLLDEDEEPAKPWWRFW